MLQRAWYAILQVVAQGLFIILFQGRAFGRERVPRRGGLLVVANHQSFFDPVLVALPICRPFSPMARESLFRYPLFKWLIRSLYAFPVKREAADLGAIREAIRRLRDGGIVLVFPEGTRTGDGSIGRLRSGVILIAERAGVPIMPAVIDGAYRCWSRDRLLPTLNAVRVIYGEPIPYEEIRGCEAEALADRLRGEMIRLQAHLR